MNLTQGLISPAQSGGSNLQASNNLSDVTDKEAAKANLGIKPSARVRTTTSLPTLIGTWTYSNGTNGIGATLTRSANGAFTGPTSIIDGVTLALNDVILIADQVSTLQNGLYTYTAVGDSTHPTIFTRHPSMAISADFNGAIINVDTEGIIWGGTRFAVNHVVGRVVGTDGVTLQQVGFSGAIPQNSKSLTYTVAAADNGKHIYHPSADTTGRTWTIDSNSNLPLPIGFAVTFINDASAGIITIAITSDTLILAGTGTTGSRILAPNGIATAIKIAPTRWIISGTGLT